MRARYLAAEYGRAGPPASLSFVVGYGDAIADSNSLQEKAAQGVLVLLFRERAFGTFIWSRRVSQLLPALLRPGYLLAFGVAEGHTGAT